MCFRSVWTVQILYDSVMRFLRPLQTVFVALATAFAGPGVIAAAKAQQLPVPESMAQTRMSMPSARHDSLSDSVRRVQRERGRVLSAERVPFEGRDINRIKYVDDRGRVRYMDDAVGPRQRVTSQARPQPQPAPPARGDNPSNP